MVWQITQAMGHCRRAGSSLARGAWLALVLAGFGCVSSGLEEPAPVSAHVIAPEDAHSEVESIVAPPLAVVIDDPRNAHLAMLQVFSARLERPYQIFNLSHRSRTSVADALRALAPVEVVAIGQNAYDLARTLPGLEVFHAGVLQPDGATQGIDALPPFDVQLDYWLNLAPGLRRLGVIGGPAMAGRVDELARTCAERGLTLEQHQVRSDTQTLLAFRSMVPRIDGFVFLPDESVLSPEVISQVMSHGSRNGVQTLVYSPVMYNLGASLYVQPDPVLVATALIELLADRDAPQEITRMQTRTRLPERLAASTATPDGVEAGF